MRAAARAVPQLMRYTCASALALGLDFSAYLALLSMGLWAAPAGTIGYGAGLALHYVLTSRFVFDAASTGKPDARLIGEFALSGLAGLVITAAVITAATDIGHMHPLGAKVVAAATSFIAVFAMRRMVVFAPA